MWSQSSVNGGGRHDAGTWLTCPPGTDSTVWMPGRGPGEAEIAPAPAWLLDLMR